MQQSQQISSDAQWVKSHTDKSYRGQDNLIKKSYCRHNRNVYISCNLMFFPYHLYVKRH